jgi:hypothetical protein
MCGNGNWEAASSGDGHRYHRVTLEGVTLEGSIFCSTRAASIFRPDHGQSQPLRAGPGKAGPHFCGHPSGLGLDWPEHSGTIDPVGGLAALVRPDILELWRFSSRC